MRLSISILLSCTLMENLEFISDLFVSTNATLWYPLFSWQQFGHLYVHQHGPLLAIVSLLYVIMVSSLPWYFFYLTTLSVGTHFNTLRHLGEYGYGTTCPIQISFTTHLLGLLVVRMVLLVPLQGVSPYNIGPLLTWYTLLF